MKFILGKKIAMTQIWKGEDVIPVTKVQAGPCLVAQVKNRAKDKYFALQLSFGSKKEKNTGKSEIGHIKKAGIKGNPRFLREFKLDKKGSQEMDIKTGDEINVGTFQAGDIVKVTGMSKGKGFQGVVKRHGFSGSKKTHGNKDQERMPGSSGATEPQHVFKGTRKPGRMGGERVTAKNLEIAEVDLENNILLIKGAIPGARNNFVMISGEGELKFIDKNRESGLKAEESKSVVQAEAKPSAGENIEKIVVEAHQKAADQKK